MASYKYIITSASSEQEQQLISESTN